MEAISTLPPARTGAAGAWRWVCVAVCAATALAACLLWSLSGSALNDVRQVVAVGVIAAVLIALALIAQSAAPHDPSGALIAVQALVVVLTNSTVLPPALDGAWMLLYAPVALLLVLVPSGRAASRRWGLAGWALVAVCAAFNLLFLARATLPFAADLPDALGVALLPLFLGLLITCALAPIARYRHADAEARLRLRWVLVAGLSLPLTLLLCWTSYLVIGGPDLVVIGLGVMLLAIPAGITVALARPRLFDVDRAALATITATVLATGVLAALSTAGIIAGSALVDWSPPAALTATAVATLSAVATYPFLRGVFERMLYPERARALRALHALSARVDQDGHAPEAVEQVLRDALRDPGLVIGYRMPGMPGLRRLDGTEVVAGDDAVPVRVRGEEAGAIIPSPQAPARLGADVVHAAGPLIDAARSRAQLSRANAEVEASRARMLRVGYEAQRRLERDLHDGTQQRLVAVGMRLRVLQRAAVHDPTVAAALDTAVAELSTAIAELRRIAHGVRPSALDDGLAAALGHLGRSTDPSIELDIHAEGVPDAVATTAYFIISEAVANALRHAEADAVSVSVRVDRGLLRIRIRDDGRGGAHPHPTGGLTGLADRAAAHGGSLDVHSPPGGGTRIEAVLPCES
ncbi:sensor histidine kinase [Microbacterium soli]|uniref:histidine kinase n=1 Tax=Microbacterium soli TaxID=446075 RepID=A0ABP7MM24_9MICO